MIFLVIFSASIFSNNKSTKEIMELLFNIQDIEKRFRMPMDEHGRRETLKKIYSFPRTPIIEHFKTNS